MTNVKIVVTIEKIEGRRREVVCHLETESEGLPEMRVVHELFLAAHEKMFPPKPEPERPHHD